MHVNQTFSAGVNLGIVTGNIIVAINKLPFYNQKIPRVWGISQWWVDEYGKKWQVDINWY